jgi:hypothetical protein
VFTYGALSAPGCGRTVVSVAERRQERFTSDGARGQPGEHRRDVGRRAVADRHPPRPPGSSPPSVIISSVPSYIVAWPGIRSHHGNVADRILILERDPADPAVWRYGLTGGDGQSPRRLPAPLGFGRRPGASRGVGRVPVADRDSPDPLAGCPDRIVYTLTSGPPATDPLTASTTPRRARWEGSTAGKCEGARRYAKGSGPSGTGKGGDERRWPERSRRP